MSPADKDPWIYLNQMLDFAEKVAIRAAKYDRQAFDANEDLQLATLHLIQLIGEAARRVPLDFRSQFPDIPWSGIVGMRTKIVHDYTDVQWSLVWDVATRDVPELAATCSPSCEGPAQGRHPSGHGAISYRDDFIPDKVETNHLWNGAGIEVTAYGVTDLGMEILDRICLGENPLTQGSGHVTAFGRLFDREDDF
jgi:uncharacterized protein with HEPN domain